MNKLDILYFEVLEKAARLDSLVEKSAFFFEAATHRKTAQTESAKAIQELISNSIVKKLQKIYLSEDAESLKADRLKHLLETIAAIHENALPATPRAYEPIELKSYLRQTQTGAIQKTPVHVFASERLGLHAYTSSLTTALEEFGVNNDLKAHALHNTSSLKDFGKAALLDDASEASSENSIHLPYIAIPAIDIDNPCRWPSLQHEIAHQKIYEYYKPKKKKSSEDLLFQDFINFHGPEKFIEICRLVSPLFLESDEDIKDDKNQKILSSYMKNWLLECWCDAYGVKVSGLSFLYSQLHDFIFCAPNYLGSSYTQSQAYPPAGFRLRLAKNLCVERLKKKSTALEQVKKCIKAYTDEQSLFSNIFQPLENDPKIDYAIANLHAYFLHFLKDKFSTLENSAHTKLSQHDFDQLKDQMAGGLPIPGKTNPGQDSQNSVSDILLISWHHRNETIRHLVLKELNRNSSSNDLLKIIKNIIARSEESAKRSIQMAEWFLILADPPENKSIPPSPFNELEDNGGISKSGLMCDRDIKNCLDSGELRIVPMLSFEEQVNGSVIDLRLGHNFEIFHPNISGIIDPCKSDPSKETDSIKLEVDLVDSATILPNQFILGHTLEYIKLPNNVAAQIEGRSSFARLGVQIHMTANLVEAGFEGCLTLEILNSGNSSVALYPGMRIAQLRFFSMSSKPDSPYDYQYNNKYGGLLSHKKTRQFSDNEVDRIKKYQDKLGGAD